MKPFELSEINNFEQSNRRTKSKNYKKSPPFSRKVSDASDFELSKVFASNTEFHNVGRMNTQQLRQPNEDGDDVTKLLDFSDLSVEQEVILLEDEINSQSPD